MQQSDSFVKQMPPWAKGVIGVIIVAGSALIIRNIIVSAKRKKQETVDNAAALSAQKDLQTLLNSGVKLSYQDSQYEAFAQELIEAMRGCGTNEQKVFDVMNAMNNKADVLKLISVFGLRTYQVCPITNPISSVIQLAGGGKQIGGSLVWWLNYDLSNSELVKVNDILSGKKIDYKF